MQDDYVLLLWLPEQSFLSGGVCESEKIEEEEHLKLHYKKKKMIQDKDFINKLIIITIIINLFIEVKYLPM